MTDHKRQQREAEIRQRLAVRKIYRAVNVLLRKQQGCGKVCHWCAEKCQELQAWLDVGGES